MQKKIIALAVAGLVSGAAFAQSNVTIYGAVDLSMNLMTGSANGAKNQTMMASGENHWTGLGFKGTEDLGNGLSATFDFLAAFNAATGAEGGNGGNFFSRNATLGLASKSFGEVQFGRRQSFTDQLLGGFDASGRQTINQPSALMKTSMGGGRYSNMIAYESARWNGFQVKLGTATGIDGNRTPSENTTGVQTDTSIRNLSAAANYMNGPLKVGFAYENNKRQSVTTNPAVEGYDAGTQWTVAAGYDFGVVAVSAELGRINYSQDAVDGVITQAGQDYRDQWTVAAMIPLGAKDRIGVNYAHAKVEFVAPGVSADTANQYGISYYHDLSKRTQFYAAYGHITQDRDGNAATSGLDPIGNNAEGMYRNGFQVGIAHSF